jgi:hypothetical protein
MFPPVPAAAGSQPKSALELYKSVWQTDPDAFQKNQGAPFPVSSAQGTVNELGVSCILQPGRIDYNIAPMQQFATAQSLPLIDDLVRLHDEIERVIKALRESNTPTVRVACVVQFAQPVPNSIDANKIISSSLPKAYRLQISNEEDFVLQINRPRPSEFSAELRMNFITKWSVDRVQILNLIAQPTAMGQVGAGSSIVGEFLVASITFDNSSVQLTRVMSKQEASAAMTEAFKGISDGIRECNIAIKGF